MLAQEDLLRPCYYSEITNTAFPLHAKQAQRQGSGISIYTHPRHRRYKAEDGRRQAPVALPQVQGGGPQGRSGLARKICSSPWFEPRTVQPVASRYTKTSMAHMFIALLNF